MTSIKRVRSIPSLVALGAMTLWSAVATADPIEVDFEITVPGSRASLTGSFMGYDRNNNGILRRSEVSVFNVDWSGSRRTEAFTHNIDDLRAFLYNITRDRLNLFISTNGRRGDRTTAALINFRRISVTGVNGPGIGRPGPQIVWHPYVGTTPTAVPEPGTLTLFGMGLLAIGFASRRRRSSR